MRQSTRRIKEQAMRDHRHIFQRNNSQWKKRTASQNLLAEEQKLDAYRARWERIKAEEAETVTARALCGRMLETIESRRSEVERWLLGEVVR